MAHIMLDEMFVCRVEGFDLLDPHTAVGVAAARRLADAGARPICLATAHPAKFPDTVARATGKDARRTEIPASPAALKDYIAKQDAHR